MPPRLCPPLGGSSRRQGVETWTGWEASLLGRALRLTAEQYARRLGVSRRAVEKWRALGTSIMPRLQMQAILDAELRMASRDVRRRFFGMLDENPSACTGTEDARTTPTPTTTTTDDSKASTTTTARDQEPALEVRVRTTVRHVLSQGDVTDAELSQWDRAVAAHARASTTTLAAEALPHLLGDAGEIAERLARPQTLPVSRHLARLLGALARQISDRFAEQSDDMTAAQWARVVDLTDRMSRS